MPPMIGQIELMPYGSTDYYEGVVGETFQLPISTPDVPNLRGKAINGYRYVISARGDSPDIPDRRKPLVGEPLLLPYDQQTEPLLVCNGQQLSVQKNLALFTLIGTRFGGNLDQFALPDLRATVPQNYTYHIANTENLPQKP